MLFLATRANTFRYVIYAALLCCCLGCEKSKNNPERSKALEVSLQWNKCLLDLDRYSEGYRPPVSARMFAYVGITAWEAALPGLPEAHTSTSGFNGLHLPKWESQTPFILPVALDAAYRTAAHCFFPHAPFPQIEKCNKLSNEITADLLKSYSAAALTASAAYGEAVANTIYQWSATDTLGHLAYLYNYDRSYKAPEAPGLWAPTSQVPMPALLPHWGNARTFVIHPEEIKVNSPVPFSREHSSPYFAQALELFSLTQPMKEENRWIAEFWSDDIAGVTYSTASRWISIANQVINKTKPDCAVALETWLKIGLALNDDAVLIWRSKYIYNTERPEAYIRENIRPDWKPIYATPSFPAYPSGHATFANSSAVVLGSIFGDHFELTDISHEGRREFLSRPRTFHSFSEMATENALSRIYIGVHLRMDCEEGLRLGRIVGEKVAALKVRY